ncbi:hypothetical protein BT67DRAFT_437303 [Trichocladium antarcticum]|uniref:Uncharacterized protein n=1 Tax=Trichocladium antarcticum TaxID=1450529 RepID=A0AAN6ZAA5_9PEZI|nr:hypothetical protein BT67DRAFT_437303 [Trichocladium antarcticum]
MDGVLRVLREMGVYEEEAGAVAEAVGTSTVMAHDIHRLRVTRTLPYPTYNTGTRLNSIWRKAGLSRAELVSFLFLDTHPLVLDADIAIKQHWVGLLRLMAQYSDVTTAALRTRSPRFRLAHQLSSCDSVVQVHVRTIAMAEPHRRDLIRHASPPSLQCLRRQPASWPETGKPIATQAIGRMPSIENPGGARATNWAIGQKPLPLCHRARLPRWPVSEGKEPSRRLPASLAPARLGWAQPGGKAAERAERRKQKASPSPLICQTPKAELPTHSMITDQSAPGQSAMGDRAQSRRNQPANGRTGMLARMQASLISAFLVSAGQPTSPASALLTRHATAPYTVSRSMLPALHCTALHCNTKRIITRDDEKLRRRGAGRLNQSIRQPITTEPD